MSEQVKYGTIEKHLWIVGFGAIACGVVPLLFKYFNVTKEQITVVSKYPDPSGCAKEYDLTFKEIELLRDNYKDILDLQEGDFLLNLSVDVGCIDLMMWATDRKALYLDTSCEPWAESGFFEASLTTSQRSVYFSRHECFAVKEYQKQIGKFPTVITSHGANPGIVSHFSKVALLNIAKDVGHNLTKKPTTRQEWAELARDLGVKTIHIAERDTQVANVPRKLGEIQSTWAVEGLIAESIQPSELAWGTNEKQFPKDGHRHDFGDIGIYLENQSHSTRVRSWTPTNGPYQGYLVTHNEAFSMADLYTVKNEQGEVTYRPTVHFSYLPCDSSVISLHELCGKNYNHEIFTRRLLTYNDIVDGMDELGILVAGHKKNAYWWGSQLTIHEAKKISPYNTATTLQVVSGVIGGMAYALQNPELGFLEPEDMDHEKVMEFMLPLLGQTKGAYTDWTPLVDRGKYFDDFNLDKEDPWQFFNVRYQV